jgi:formiminotetrahydrofolate cyclodeaminase
MPAEIEDSEYAQQQEELKRQLEEGHQTAASRLREEVEKAVQKEPEVNPTVYEGVEQLLFRGFLTLQAEVNEVPFLLKSLNQHEFERLSWYSTNAEKYQALLLAYGVFVIDGINVLANRETHLPKLIDFFEELPPTARRKLVRHLSEVNRKANNAVALTEAYVTETYSRFRWSQLRGLDLTTTAVTGIEGTSVLGLNWGQLVWRALNAYEDKREEAEREWDNAKFIGGCLAGKGIQKVYNQDRERRKNDRKEKLDRKDQVLRQVLLGEDPDSKGGGGRIAVKAAQSVEELVDQLEQDLKGEKDWHDQVVAQEEQRMRDQYQSHQQHLVELASVRDNEFGGSNILGGSDLTGLSKKEVAERIERRKQLAAQAAASRKVPLQLLDPRYEEFHEKWGTYERGDLADKDPSDARPIEKPRQTGTPFRRK